ncbi:hypothetical protein COLAER_00055 [Collinsella aerofaciens ATCC 25986]|uniref:Uncharacterized protein n=1 Tax=Collinsella aerofaciens (strain ATCC 25986 / DSM 3979 / JCM 10188 / KCTC 3647 / NCTC 11838 / VPI 1003) TaxID=411903 RepID=A4E6N0_COLAA|nr:hypothetical protein COLAER_00055 [Collinsella aerofaciens ATCC 25986]
MTSALPCCEEIYYGTKNVSARRNSKLPKNCRQVMEYAGKLGS